MAMHGKIKFLVDQVQDESASDAELKAWDRAFFPLARCAPYIQVQNVLKRV